jgi:DNA sulfur modification protein DndE
MQINIKTSEANHKVVSELTRKLPAGTKENVIARIAIGYSISLGQKFQLKEMKDQKGKEYKDHILFDERFKDFYISLICQHYGIYKTDDDIPKYIKMHLDHGLEMMGNMFESNRNYTIFDFLLDHIEKGIEELEDVKVGLEPVKNYNQNFEKEYFSEPIKLQVGRTIDGELPIILNANDISKYNNFHFAVAGNTGTGKTQFALDMLCQYIKESNNKINFIYLDFKGLKKDDVLVYRPFFEKTNSIFIDAPQKPFPLNPLSFIDNINQYFVKNSCS